MQKNNKGFTLIELMAVIAILALIIVVAVPNVMKMSKNVKEDMFCSKVENIEKAAQQWGYDNYDLIDNTKDVAAYNFETKANVTYQHAKMVTVKQLVQKGYYKKDDKSKDEVLDPRDDSDMLDKNVLVFIKSGRVYANYQYDSEDDYKACKE